MSGRGEGRVGEGFRRVWVIATNIPQTVSGGQIGADRAALYWAFSTGIECGGWRGIVTLSDDGS